jgi:hypothetical protein
MEFELYLVHLQSLQTFMVIVCTVRWIKLKRDNWYNFTFHSLYKLISFLLETESLKKNNSPLSLFLTFFSWLDRHSCASITQAKHWATNLPSLDLSTFSPFVIANCTKWHIDSLFSSSWLCNLCAHNNFLASVLIFFLSENFEIS